MSLLDDDAMPYTVTVKRQTYSQDSLGATLPSETVVSAGIKADIQLGSQSELKEMERRDQRITHTVFLNHRPSGFNLNDLIYITAIDDDPGNDVCFVGDVLTILAFADTTAGRGLALGLLCEKSRLT